MKDLAAILESPAFVPISVEVFCNQENVISVSNTAEDIERSLMELLNKASVLFLLPLL